MPTSAVGVILSSVYIIVTSGRSTSGAKPASDDAMKTLSDLNNLRAEGAITDQDYEAKKAELLKRV